MFMTLYILLAGASLHVNFNCENISEIFSVIFYWTSLWSKLRNVSNVTIKIDPESQNIILNIYMSNVFTYDMLCMHCTCGSWEYSAIILTAGVFWQKWK